MVQGVLRVVLFFLDGGVVGSDVLHLSFTAAVASCLAYRMTLSLASVPATQAVVLSVLTIWGVELSSPIASKNSKDTVFLFEEIGNRRKRRRKTWCREWIRRREHGGHWFLGMVEHELRVEDPSAYNNFLRLNVTEFSKLISLVEGRILKADTLMRPSLSAERKYVNDYPAIFGYRIHKSTISRFIPEVCNAIYYALHHVIQVPATEAECESISHDFLNLWQVPNCIGAVDGKHVNFRAPRNMGSYYYNYKGHHSIILMAVADALYKFKYIYVGVNGRVNDSVVFRESELYEPLINTKYTRE
ncbi:hypothetical protein J437_LFUL001078 [Ladona fulva]|uniref:DDE Tnp4 domain-containing protein n=1 Tax=Ladona fulva TaxID=123851 RepID=A0A8K0NYK4_LADFU|nr:hypothetical protein J437_LFUL001078 [Ladona fulva]